MTTSKEKEVNRKRLAVLKCYCLWAWLERNSRTTTINPKKHYPIKEILASRVNHHCALCEYCDKLPSGFPICTQCPMFNRWPSFSVDDTTETCIDYGSQYMSWENNNKHRLTTGRKNEVAGNIAQALWKLYKELERR